MATHDDAQLKDLMLASASLDGPQAPPPKWRVEVPFDVKDNVDVEKLTQILYELPMCNGYGTECKLIAAKLEAGKITLDLERRDDPLDKRDWARLMADHYHVSFHITFCGVARERVDPAKIPKYTGSKRAAQVNDGRL